MLARVRLAMAESQEPQPGWGGASQRDELLATKVSVPRVQPGYLSRPRLLEALDEATARDLTVVCTPAGFGKTTLLAHWADQVKRPVAWFSLDPDDGDPVRFWRYVVASLERAGVVVGERVRSLLEAPRGVSSEGVAIALLNELEPLPDEVALVFDDYHLIQSQSVHDGMTFLVSHLPPPLHVLIASRSDPPLPLARLRALGQLAELRAADLRFAPQESAAFLREVWGLELSQDAVDALDVRTEGWAVGLQLAALSLQGRSDPGPFVEAFTGTNRYILDYLSEEVLERQPDKIRTFLLETSILERQSGPLCDAVTGRSDGQHMLEELEGANLFLVPQDDERRWYRFHHLFGDLLRVRLQQIEGGRVADLHRRAATWYEQHGLIDEAIRHASASGDATWPAQLVEQHLDETLHRGEEVILARWLSVLPEEAVRSRPALALAQGLMAFHSGHLDSVERLLQHAEHALDPSRESLASGVPTTGGIVAEVPAAIALLRAELAAARGDGEGAAGHARSVLAQLSEEEHGPRFWARWLLAFADWMGGRLEDAERAFAQLVVEGRAASDLYPVMSTGSTLARVQRARGKLGAALRTYREGLRFVTEDGRLAAPHAGEPHVGMAQVFCERNELDEALEHVIEGIELCRQVMVLRERDRGLVTLAWIRQAMGDPEGALEAMSEACRMYPSTGAASLFNPAPSERARLLLLQGRIAEAERWTEERGLTEEDALSYPHERDYLVLARVLLARFEGARALELLDRLDGLAEAQGRRESLIQIRALRSLACRRPGIIRGHSPLWRRRCRWRTRRATSGSSPTRARRWPPFSRA